MPLLKLQKTIGKKPHSHAVEHNKSSRHPFIEHKKSQQMPMNNSTSLRNHPKKETLRFIQSFAKFFTPGIISEDKARLLASIQKMTPEAEC